MRAKDSKKQNRQELFAEHARLKDDPAKAKKLNLKRDEAIEKLAKLDAASAGEDFERKRAWDYSIEDSQEWDKKMEKTRHNQRRAGFGDYISEAVKQYERETAFKSKASLADGDEERTIHSTELVTDTHTAQDLTFMDNKPSKARVDALVDTIAARDAQRDKTNARRRAKKGDPGSYINDRNRKFNQKAARAYDLYTKEMRDSFERGTAQ
jgi:pre-mRNA-splicing factor SYF2